MLSKQTMSIALVPFSLWVLSAALGRTEYAKTIRTQWVLAFAAGFAAPLAIVLCRYAFAGALETFFYYFFEYNRDVYMAPLRGVLGLELFEFWFAQNLPLIAVAAALAFGLITSAALADKRAKYLDRNGFAVTIALTTFAVGVTCNATLRGFGHYFLQLFPWAGLLIGYVLECVVLPEGLLGLPSFIMLTVWAAAADWGWSYQFNSNAFRSLRAQVTDPSATELCSYLHEHTRPYDPVFIWGFYAEPYVSCRVTPATRYVYTTFPAGVVPWFESSLEVENQRAVPGSRALLLQDLETTKPPVIVDFAASLMNRSMTRYRELADYLERHYCPDEHLANGDVYLRKQKGQSCP
jgi:hypothetical protein